MERQQREARRPVGEPGTLQRLEALLDLGDARQEDEDASALGDVLRRFWFELLEERARHELLQQELHEREERRVELRRGARRLAVDLHRRRAGGGEGRLQSLDAIHADGMHPRAHRDRWRGYRRRRLVARPRAALGGGGGGASRLRLGDRAPAEIFCEGVGVDGRAHHHQPQLRPALHGCGLRRRRGRRRRRCALLVAVVASSLLAHRRHVAAGAVGAAGVGRGAVVGGVGRGGGRRSGLRLDRCRLLLHRAAEQEEEEVEVDVSFVRLVDDHVGVGGEELLRAEDEQLEEQPHRHEGAPRRVERGDAVA